MEYLSLIHIFVGEPHRLLAGGHAGVDLGGAGGDLAGLSDQGGHVVPGALVLVAAHGQQDIGQLGQGGGRVDGVGHDDLAGELGL